LLSLRKGSEKFYYGKMLRAYAKNAPEKYFKFVGEALKKYPANFYLPMISGVLRE
jgi:hypothetical protein